MRDECGATAILIALLMVPLLGFAAITIDVGAIYAERRQLQNGADAAALAIAQVCAEGSCPADASAFAASYAAQNANDNAANASATVLPASGSVTVNTSTKNPDTSTGLAHFFAPILGIDSTEVPAGASAAWGWPSSGPAVLPVTFAHCWFDGKIGVHQLIRSDVNRPECPGTTLPGGFGWIDHQSQCTVDPVAIDEVYNSAPGNGPKGDYCLTSLNAMKSDINAGKRVIVILPVHDETYNGGNNGTYKIKGFAAFRITGWKFGGGSDLTFNAPLCSGNCRGIEGEFVEYVSMDEDDFELGGPAMGATVVKLTLGATP